MQMFLSNFTLTSIMDAFYLNSKFVINIEAPINPNSTINLDTKLISVFIPQIISAYGIKPISIVIEAIDYPTVSMAKNNLTINAKMDITLNIKDKDVIKALVI